MEKLSNDLKKQVMFGKIKLPKIEIFGITHYKYEDCGLSNIVEIEGYKAHKLCAIAFQKMQKSALNDDIQLKIVSAFRSQKYQIEIFNCKWDINSIPTDDEFYKRLKYSAPSGYSEHHTGLALDINSLEEDFAQTKEYEWLLNNAHKFGFEMSFPQNNKQNLGFEPWHWRYIGNDFDKNIFAQAKM